MCKANQLKTKQDMTVMPGCLSEIIINFIIHFVYHKQFSLIHHPKAPAEVQSLLSVLFFMFDLLMWICMTNLWTELRQLRKFAPWACVFVFLFRGLLSIIAFAKTVNLSHESVIWNKKFLMAYLGAGKVHIITAYTLKYNYN